MLNLTRKRNREKNKITWTRNTMTCRGTRASLRWRNKIGGFRSQMVCRILHLVFSDLRVPCLLPWWATPFLFPAFLVSKVPGSFRPKPIHISRMSFLDDVFIGRTTYIHYPTFPVIPHFWWYYAKHPMSPQHVNITNLFQWLVLWSWPCLKMRR